MWPMMSIGRLQPYNSLTVPRSEDQDNILKSILSSKKSLTLRKIDKPIVLYGAGKLGRMAKEFFDYVGQPISFVVDIYADRQATDPFWKNTKVVHPQDVTQSDKDEHLLIVCIVTSPLIALRDKLTTEGWEDIAFFYDIAQTYSGRHPLNNGWLVNEFTPADRKNIREVFSSLHDEISRAHYLQFLAWRRTRVELLFEKAPIQGDNRFFIPEVLKVLHEKEVFVDCGAHKGFVIDKFLETMHGRYKKIYAIEPDMSNYKILKKAFGDKEDLKLVESALTSKKGERSFYRGFDFASKISPKGTELIKTMPLDDLDIPATFIKMHLEGGELNALKGALRTIRDYRPILALTVYHNSDGIWKTPLFLMRNLENYSFIMRLHSWAGTGMVLYAIPKENRA